MSDLTLIEAVKKGDRDAAAARLAGGADIHQQDEHGWTALNWAAGRGDVEAVGLLLAQGADATRVGRDQRTPYMIALAGGHAEAARLLREAEEGRDGGEQSTRPERKYCRAYPESELAQFPDWHANKIRLAAESREGGEGADALLYLHQDYRVTESMWENENVVFDEVSAEWKEFCTSVLKFKVQDDFDLIVEASDARQGAAA